MRIKIPQNSRKDILSHRVKGCFPAGYGAIAYFGVGPINRG